MSDFKQWIIWAILAVAVLYLVKTHGFAFVGNILHWMAYEFGRIGI